MVVMETINNKHAFTVIVFVGGYVQICTWHRKIKNYMLIRKTWNEASDVIDYSWRNDGLRPL